MNDTTKRFYRTLDEVLRDKPEWRTRQDKVKYAYPIQGPFNEHGGKMKQSWPVIFFCFAVIICLYLGAIMYLHIASAAGPAFREIADQEALEKRMQAECGENSVVTLIGNGYWKCQDKRGRVTKTLKE
jgi:hypothetical protein